MSCTIIVSCDAICVFPLMNDFFFSYSWNKLLELGRTVYSVLDLIDSDLMDPSAGYGLCMHESFA